MTAPTTSGADSRPEIGLTAVERPGSLDARRGVARMGPAAMQALGLRPWDPVELRGQRVTGALVAQAPLGSDERALLVDSLTLRNLQVASGTLIGVRRALSRPAVSIEVSAAPEVMAAVPPDVVRTALLGKVVVRGDQVSLLPQDFALPPGADWVDVRKALAVFESQLEAWTTVDLLVTGGDPTDPAIVTMATVVAWATGDRTSSSGRAATVDVYPAAIPQAAGSLQPPPAAASAAAPTPAPVPAPTGAEVAVQAVVPGLEGPSAELLEQLDLAFHHQELLARLGTTAQTGILLSGAAGSGKASMVDQVSAAVGATVVRLRCQQLATLETDAAAQQVADAVRRAAASRPAVVVLEDVEALTSEVPGQADPLLTVVADAVTTLVADPRIAVVATTAAPESVSMRLRGTGLLDRTIAIPLPARAGRVAVLAALTKSVPLAPDVALDDVAARTPGYVLADLQSLVHEAAVRAAHRSRAADPSDAGAQVTAADFAAALEVVRPTSLDGQGLEAPDLTFDDVGDMEAVKQVLTEAVLWPLAYPDTFRRLGVSPARGVLLYGPPGCGKTYLVRALAGTGQANVLPVKGAELMSKWVGESERGVRELFRRAREAAPSLVFLDEVDALAPQRGQGSDSGVGDRVVAALLTELDGIEALRDVVVVAATNRPDLVDAALLRPGRFDRLVFVPPPDAAARAEILRAASRLTPWSVEVDLDALAARLDGYSAADCTAVVREAALAAMRESMTSTTVGPVHLEAALAVVRPSIRPDQLALLEAFAATHTADLSD